MKIASWNVNSLKVRLPHLLDWLGGKTGCPVPAGIEARRPEFPAAEIEAAGYQVAFSGQKTYNGVALLAREPIHDIVCGNPHFPDEQKRLISGSIGDVRVICAYMPNGQAVGSEKYDYKLRWLDGLAVWLDEEMQKYPKLALCGDYNIAPDDRDVHDPRPGPAAFFAPNPSAPPSSASSDWA
jgi:exodeoxyribonuclease-3